MSAVVTRPGEGERLDAEHLINLSSAQLDVLEFTVDAGYEGPGPHFHEQHVDAFFVLDGELEFRAGDETVRAAAGTSVAVPPGVVHSFTNAGPGGARFLNFHAPGGFAEYMRARARGNATNPADFDIHDVDAPGGDGTALVAPADGGELVEFRDLMIRIRADRPELALLDFTIEPTWSGVDAHHHDDHIDSFFVLAGEVEYFAAGASIVAGPGTLVSVPIGITHGIVGSKAQARFLNLHTPESGFVAGIREAGTRRRAG